MALAGLRSVTMAYGGPPLLDEAELQIEAGEHVCLLGRNGAGKSTLMRLLNGEMSPDDGQVEWKQGTSVAMLDQHVPESMEGTVYEVAAGGLGDRGALLSQYHEVSRKLAERGDDQELLEELDRLHHRLDAENAWSTNQQVDAVINKLGLQPDVAYNAASGGQKRRTLLARSLVAEPDLLLLDEPTNHLDLDAIRWLEGYLNDFKGALLFVTHDRRFLKNVARRIVELDRGQLISWDCDYETYLKRKEEALQIEEQQRHNFDKKLQREEEWMRRTPKARKQRNMGRVRKLQEMRQRRRQRRYQPGQANMQVQDAERSGSKVIEVKNLSFSYEDSGKKVIEDFTTRIMRGDKIGIIGPNGAGKTTLIRLLLGDLEADSGIVKHGTKLQVAYFDQHRAQFDEEAPVYTQVADGTMVEIDGHKKHVVGYLEDFLFHKERSKGPVKLLSGGERNRLLLARLFAQPSNVLVMDEPTNDLDTETLELLEQRLVEYEGTIMLVSHDREFLDNVVTGLYVLRGDGRVQEFVGGYDDWRSERLAAEKMPSRTNGDASSDDGSPKSSTQTDKAKTKESKDSGSTSSGRPKKLSYREQQELEELPGKIDKLENEQQELYDQMSDPDFYQEHADEVEDIRNRLQEIEQELEQLLERWEELETVREASS